MKCDDMMTVNISRIFLKKFPVAHVWSWIDTSWPPRGVFAQCYLFHMYVGVRAGGGIGDEIEDPAGDPYELYRILFDITFFFFVIVILLAIIQGELKRYSLNL